MLAGALSSDGDAQLGSRAFFVLVCFVVNWTRIRRCFVTFDLISRLTRDIQRQVGVNAMLTRIRHQLTLVRQAGYTIALVVYK